MILSTAPLLYLFATEGGAKRFHVYPKRAWRCERLSSVFVFVVTRLLSWGPTRGVRSMREPKVVAPLRGYLQEIQVTGRTPADLQSMHRRPGWEGPLSARRALWARQSRQGSKGLFGPGFLWAPKGPPGPKGPLWPALFSGPKGPFISCFQYCT